MTSGRASILALFLFLSASCGGASTTPDGGADTGTAADASDMSADAPVDLGTSMDLGPDAPCPDVDLDGHHAMSCGGDDCDDADPTAYPGATEACDAVGHDEDCNPATVGTLDVDTDGVVSNGCCNGPAGGARTCGADCNDADPTTNPTAPEVCDGADNDCDGNPDDGLPPFEFFPDCDGDGHGDMAGTSIPYCGIPPTPPVCASGTGHWVMSFDDCDDSRAGTFPGSLEHCDGRDDDCDGMVEADADSDGHFMVDSCTPTGGETGDDDCDDGLALVHPGADYQSTSYCPSGTRVCSVLILAGGFQNRCVTMDRACPSGTCSGADVPCTPPTFDYDCSGAIERMPPVGAGPGAAGCSGVFSGCSANDGFYYSGTPACGSAVAYTSCGWVTMPIPGYCTGGATTRNLPCR